MTTSETVNVRDLILDAETLEAIRGTTRNDLIGKKREKAKSVPQFRTNQAGPHSIVVTRAQGGRDRWRLAVDGEEGSVVLWNLTRRTSVRVTDPADLTPFFRNVKEPIETGSRWLPELLPAMAWRRALLSLLADPHVREAVKADLYLMEGEALGDHRYPQCPDAAAANGTTDDWGKGRIPRFNKNLCERLAAAIPWRRRHLETRGKVTEPEIYWVTQLAPALDIIASRFGVAWVRVWLEEAAKATFDLGHPATRDYGMPSMSASAEGELKGAAKDILADLDTAGYDTDAPNPTLAGWLVREASRQGYAETPLRFMVMWAQCLRWQAEAWGAIVEERPRDVRSKTLAASAHARAASMDALAQRAPRLERTIEAAPLEEGVSAFALACDVDIRKDALGFAAMAARQDGPYFGSTANPYLQAVLDIPASDVDVLAIDADGLHLRAFLPTTVDAATGDRLSTQEKKGHPLDRETETGSKSNACGVWVMTPMGSTYLTNASTYRTNARLYASAMRQQNGKRTHDSLKVEGVETAALDKALRAYGTILKARLDALGLRSW